MAAAKKKEPSASLGQVASQIGQSILEIHLISSGMIQDFRCSTNASSKRKPCK